MKKYLVFVIISIMCYFLYDYGVFYSGMLFVPNTQEIECFAKADSEKLWVDEGDGFEVFDIKGVNLGLGKPGKFATDYSITEEEYIRWFTQIQEVGANVIRTYTIAHDTFYKAFYDYNKDNPNPLYLIHGVWVDDYMLNSHRDAFDKKFEGDLLKDCKDVIDIIHGRHKRAALETVGKQNYKYDISPWVYGYIVGVEWEGDIVAFTNETAEQREQYKGKYLYTENAANFEIFLASIGDRMIEYETEKYGTQRTLAFSNWPATDPFLYPEDLAIQYRKFARVDVENIKSTRDFIGGQYASYHIYPYYPEYDNFLDQTTENTYLSYLARLNQHHTQPVVISEFGVPSSRGMASYEQNRNLGRNQGNLNEQQQGEAIVSLYNDIKNAGLAGGIVFIWQDEWFKRTWNTIPYVDLNQIIYWSDYQTNEQSFGLLSFDPGKEESICYVDGDKGDWGTEDIVTSQEGHQLSVKYDERFIYFLVEKVGFDYEKNKIYLPMDLTPKSGSTHIGRHNIKTNKPTDFLIEINGKNESRVWVQDRYHTTRAIYGNQLIHKYNPYQNPPAKDSTNFEKINLTLHELNYYKDDYQIEIDDYDFANEGEYYTLLQSYETGKLLHGNANPKAVDFNSLADFCFGNGFVEIKTPWQLLNFSNPSQMKIHDDYYEHFGVEQIRVKEMFIGVGSGQEKIEMKSLPLEGWGRKVTYHERLKESYYILQKAWLEEK
ncbi:hypothetical protein [Anaerotignum sp. MB30-C6]|uniref:hypothetical protein n=1 Tax=Anaerotignum sp. MB30-C6 TaxID=3070814 RepID=UPI0027DDF500|nr:hypothetical protein [Anaerotignum sp. MB30-C6]WMI82630.1 hypothetical protein RBQ60_07855 [Anaerotignum sp. MB30-C6]